MGCFWQVFQISVTRYAYLCTFVSRCFSRKSLKNAVKRKIYINLEAFEEVQDAQKTFQEDAERARDTLYPESLPRENEAADLGENATG